MTLLFKFLYSNHQILNGRILMKKFLLIIFSLLSIFFISYNYSNARSVADFTPAIDKKVAKMKTTEEKVKRLKSFSELLTNPKFTQDKNARLFEDIREYSLNMLRVFEFELKEEQTKSDSKTNTKSTSSKNTTVSTTKLSIKDLPHLSDNFSNINEQKVREAILSRHNEERDNVWVNPYAYNLDLEWSATTWATKLADSGKTSNLHLRNSWDWYYNYDSMLNWFYSLWIKFPASVKWAASFSESVWYGSYKCSSSDCTQTLIDAIKKTWTWLIMKEKSSNGSHYRAATMKHFTQMWAGIAIDKDNNRYYLVIHYGVEF